ncbi:shikimate kinase [Saccharicrinis carchari]|uniref:Shikimate kinase n=1 Tax=Saccharicrinis carchari TaxID=1168039 RepID=A0A521CSP2_SACCC|nr:shikimate kinase [Saccharicrinis carchari]SMO62494.1 shikimate kinase [Saccharicrinis carchari]
MTQRVYLIGFMGSGKSTLGRWLADTMEGWTFLDLDHFIENKFHKTIAQIFDEKGEQGFRQIEAMCLNEVSSFEKVIIGAGGGTPCFFDNMEVMNNSGLTIYLQLRPEVIYQRLQTSKTQRPLISGMQGIELLNFIKHKLSQREPYYLKAKLIADAENWKIVDFVKAIAKHS